MDEQGDLSPFGKAYERKTVTRLDQSLYKLLKNKFVKNQSSYTGSYSPILKKEPFLMNFVFP